MGTGMSQIFTLEPDGSSTGEFGKAGSLVKWSGATNEFFAVSVEFGNEIRIHFDLVVGLFDFLECN